MQKGSGIYVLQKLRKKLEPGQRFCPDCGAGIEEIPGNQAYFNVANAQSVAMSTYQIQLLHTLSGKIKTNAVIWIVIAAVQVILGFVYNWIILVIGILNLISCVRDLLYTKTLLVKPTGIVEKYKPLTEPIITLAYNLVFGGVIGVAGTIYYLLAIRSYVIQNEQELRQIERLYS